MKENEFDKLLEKICREQIEPSSHLVVSTKQEIRRSPFLNLLIFLSLSLNALVMVVLGGVIVWPGLGWADRIPLFFGIATFFDGLIVLILLQREKVTAFFRELTFAVYRYN